MESMKGLMKIEQLPIYTLFYDFETAECLAFLSIKRKLLLRSAGAFYPFQLGYNNDADHDEQQP